MCCIYKDDTKIYIRDSGLSNALLNIKTMDDVLGHPLVGASWEGFIIENLLSCLTIGSSAWFYRTSAGAEIDLVITQGNKKYAIEIKRSLSPSLSKGFHLGCEDIRATHRFVVYSGKERFHLTKEVIAIPLIEMMKELQLWGQPPYFS